MSAATKPRYCPICRKPLTLIMVAVDVMVRREPRQHWRAQSGCQGCGVRVQLHLWPKNWRLPTKQDQRKAAARRLLGLTR